MPNALVGNINSAWLGVLNLLTAAGAPIAPRGKKTLEWPQTTISTRLNDCVLTIGLRKLNYRFMAAEARWIINGQDDVDSIAQYNPNIAQFSDNGRTFFGAYGPRYRSQLPYVVQKLAEDPNTRQAGMTLWQQNPPQTKDVPCTVALFFQIRQGELNVHVFMRSSDAWLGLPYDVFNFSMLGYHVLGFVNQRRAGDYGDYVDPVKPGTLYLTMASSHLYEEHIEPAKAIIEQFNDPTAAWLHNHPQVPEILASSETTLLAHLDNVADGARIARWWELPL